MTTYVLAIDQGTTSSRSIIFDESFNTVSVSQQEFTQIFPQSGWVEHDPEEIWSSTLATIKDCISKAGITPQELSSIGITNQRETAMIWDKTTGLPVCNAAVWQCQRGVEYCNQLKDEDKGALIMERTGLIIDPYFSASKLKWMIDKVDGLKDKMNEGILLAGTMDSWLVWKLTGGRVHATDYSNACRTMLLNLETLDWDDEILEIMGIPRSMLPKIVPSSDPNTWGNTLADGPFGGEIPVCGDLGDQQAATVGQACFSPGEAKNTYGTGCFMILNTGPEIVPSNHGLLTTTCYKFGNEPTVYALEGSIAITGALVQWLRDNLNMFDYAPHIEDYAKEVKDNGGVYFVPAFSGLFAPYWKSDARGVIVGLTRYVNKGHIARAALEATAYQTREVLDAMEKDSGVELTALKVDGGMVYNDTLMQFQADVLGVPVIRPEVAETTALGAAYAAGMAVGFWSGAEELRKNWAVDKTWQPAMDSGTREKYYREWKKAVDRTFGWVN